MTRKDDTIKDDPRSVRRNKEQRRMRTMTRRIMKGRNDNDK